jgi:glycosyltransferase involved in cell wall biosynthesis
MRISIVTLSYNQGTFLEDCIDSIITQRDVELEYIIVDPGSTDDSRSIINRHRAKIDRIILEPDSGPAAGLNKGFALATGDIFGFINADDTLLPNALTEVSAFFSSHPDVDVVSGHCKIIDANGKVLRSSYSDLFSLRGYAYGSVVLMQPSTFFRSSSFRAVGGFNEMNRSNWDGELFVRFGEIGCSFRRIKAFWSAYRVHSESITGGSTLDAQVRRYHLRMFSRFTGREWLLRDSVLAVWFRIWKYLRTPQSFWERLIHGRIYGRSVR